MQADELIDIEPLVNAKVAARALGISVRALYVRLAKERKKPPFPVYTIARQLFFKLSEVAAYIERQKRS